MPLITAGAGGSQKRAADQRDAEAGSSRGKRQRTFKENHTLDSDEEDADMDNLGAAPAEKAPPTDYAVLHDDDIEGQEEGSMKVQEGIRITPFNVQEELEEGEFDTEGNFHFSKSKEISDAWLDNLDAYTDEDYEALMQRKQAELAAQEAAAGPAPSDTQLYQTLLTHLRPGESVAKALRRLGDGLKTTKRYGKAARKEGSEALRGELEALTAAADQLLGKGNLEVYQDTYEAVKFKLEKAEKKMAGMRVDEELDMFGEAFDAGKVGTGGTGSAPLATAESDEEEDNGTLWEYKWENSDAAPTHGPYSSEQMQAWQQQGFFKDAVFVRKAGAVDAPFYSSKRVDFELYM
ncbi:CD2 antigen cytoplasmic tail-binding protein 2-like [Paramacrobiotus metropolitanus]|uniref:CD2 antigen cytoplasmic tail-binding protein 2-like n=1 Tax=Paramacrobiotus metropolitanus TaxID=2943436 RepID=UPI002445D082|nr:CD2 antigen cytoplasmic tail-binding protein 2-like [Paramacrobiotus metropolitanus]